MALKVLDVCQRAEASAAEVAEVVAPDPSISLRLLRLANSPSFAARRQVGSIHDAVTRVGRATTQALAVEAALGADEGASSPPMYWRRSLTSAAAADLCARTLYGPLPDAFSCGLLLDIGCHVLFRVAPADYPEVIGDNSDSHTLLVEHERQAISMTHCEAGALALLELGLPETTYSILVDHHERPAPDKSPLAIAVIAGAALADAYIAGDYVLDATPSSWLTELVGNPELLHQELDERVEALCS